MDASHCHELWSLLLGGDSIQFEAVAHGLGSGESIQFWAHDAGSDDSIQFEAHDAGPS